MRGRKRRKRRDDWRPGVDIGGIIVFGVYGKDRIHKSLIEKSECK
jgi:hypothetical protein